jgi:hypothetical protein
MTRSVLEVIRWMSGILLIASGLSVLKSAISRSWMGLFTILWIVTSIALIAVGVLVLKWRSPNSHGGQLRWTLGFLGLILLPTVLVSLMLLSPPGGGPGFGGAYAAGAVGQALLLSLYASPIPAIAGYLIGLWLDIRKGNRPKIDDTRGL